MNEVWVPSPWQRDSFIASGVDPTKIVVVPEGINTTLYDPINFPPMDLASKAQLVFGMPWKDKVQRQEQQRQRRSLLSAADATAATVPRRANAAPAMAAVGSEPQWSLPQQQQQQQVMEQQQQLQETEIGDDEGWDSLKEAAVNEQLYQELVTKHGEKNQQDVVGDWGAEQQQQQRQQQQQQLFKAGGGGKAEPQQDVVMRMLHAEEQGEQQQQEPQPQPQPQSRPQPKQQLGDDPGVDSPSVAANVVAAAASELGSNASESQSTNSGSSSSRTGRQPFVFLSAFKWERRKGWDVLLEAYLSEFTPEDDVELYILTKPYGKSGDEFQGMMQSWAKAKLGDRFGEGSSQGPQRKLMGVEGMGEAGEGAEVVERGTAVSSAGEEVMTGVGAEGGRMIAGDGGLIMGVGDGGVVDDVQGGYGTIRGDEVHEGDMGEHLRDVFSQIRGWAEEVFGVTPESSRSSSSRRTRSSSKRHSEAGAAGLQRRVEMGNWQEDFLPGLAGGSSAGGVAFSRRLQQVGDDLTQQQQQQQQQGDGVISSGSNTSYLQWSALASNTTAQSTTAAAAAAAGAAAMAEQHAGAAAAAGEATTPPPAAAAAQPEEKPARRFPTLYVVNQHLSDEEFPRIYSSSDAFVLPSRGEGWGRPHVEAMSMGLPIIATNWSGITAYLDESVGYPLAVDSISPVQVMSDSEWWFRGLSWAQPSVSHLRQLMRRVYENREEAREKGRAARQRMVDKYSPEPIADVVLKEVLRIQELLG